MRNTIRSAVVAGVMGLSSVAFAQFFAPPQYINELVVWSQPVGSAIFEGEPLKLNPGHIQSGLNFGTVRADDFILTTSKPVVAVRWWGVYAQANTVAPDTGGVYAIPFTIDFYNSSSPVPTANPNGRPTLPPIAQYNTVMATRNVFVDGSGAPVQDTIGQYVYQFEAWITPTQLSPGSQYYIAIGSDATWAGKDWAWKRKQFPTITQNYMASADSFNSVWGADGIDRAFVLMVPEPAVYQFGAVALAGISFAGMQLWRRRRQQV